MATASIYVGFGTNLLREIFRSSSEPTSQSHGDKYLAVMGPFRTIRGAKAEVHYGLNNPHICHVRDAERIGKKYAKELMMLPTSRVGAPS